MLDSFGLLYILFILISALVCIILCFNLRNECDGIKKIVVPARTLTSLCLAIDNVLAIHTPKLSNNILEKQR
jgi:hypothetical protein